MSDSSDESPKKQHFVTSFDLELDEIPTREQTEEDPIEENEPKEDNISVLTDDTSASVGDGNTKKNKKKKLMNILKIGRKKRKSKDGLSVTSSATSLACSEISNDPANQPDLEVECTIREKVEISESTKEKNDDVSHVEPEHEKQKGSTISRRLITAFSSMRVKKGKNNDVTAQEIEGNSKPIENQVNETNVDPIPLGLGTNKTEESPPHDLEINLQKKPFWRTFSKREKNKKNSSKGIIDGIKPNPIKKKDDTKVELGTDASKIYGSNTIIDEVPIVEKKKTLLETLKITKKEETSNQKNDHQGISQMSCFSACVNSNIKPENERKSSTDSIEVKTIADEDLESDGNTIRIVRNEFFPVEVHTTSPVDGQLNISNENGDNKVNVEAENLIEQENILLKNTHDQEDEKNSEIAKEEEIDRHKDEEKISEEEEGNDTASDKIYGVFEKEDFSESLHTLVEEGSNYILLAPSSAIVSETDKSEEIKESNKSEDIKEDNKSEEKDHELPEGIFRTSCRLSIEGSENLVQKSEEIKHNENEEEDVLDKIENEVESGKEEIVKNVEEGDIIADIIETHLDNIEKNNSISIEKSSENIPSNLPAEHETSSEEVENAVETKLSSENMISSSETLTEVEDNSNDIGKSTETLKNTEEESVNTSWVEVTNVNDLDESKFNYIYQTTLKAVQRGGATPPEENSIDDENLSDPNKEEDKDETDNTELNLKQLESSCDICGKSIEEEKQARSEEDKETAKCVCTTLTKPRQSLGDIEEGSVKNKIEAFNKSKHPIIVPLTSVDVMKKGNE